MNEIVGEETQATNAVVTEVFQFTDTWELYSSLREHLENFIMPPFELGNILNRLLYYTLCISHNNNSNKIQLNSFIWVLANSE
jgi:hypothetical protein